MGEMHIFLLAEKCVKTAPKPCSSAEYQASRVVYGGRTLPRGSLILPAEEPVNRDMQYICQGIQFNIRYRTFLTFQKGKRRHTQINASGLQLCQELNLLQALFEPGFCYAGTHKIAVSQRKLSHFQKITPCPATNYMLPGDCYIWYYQI